VGRLDNEKYRLADPFICLVCGGADPEGMHFCCPVDEWGDRFTRVVEQSERNEQIAKLAAALRITYQGAEQEVSLIGHKWGDYSEVARAFASALADFRVFVGSRVHPEDCGDCTVLDEALVEQHPIERGLWPKVPGRCPLARLHFLLVTLACCEDARHDLPPGSTQHEIERRTRERHVAQQLERLQGATVGEIVNRTLSGGA
jgi:hypothetical protein